MNELESRIAENLDRVRQRIRDAADSAGRDATEVTLIGVTKYVGVPEVRALIAAGCDQLGESRPQSLWDKTDTLAAEEALDPDSVVWHLIGHLQRNKVRRTLPALGQGLIHSVDSLRLLMAIEEAAAGAAVQENANSAARPVRVLLEVNVSGDQEKHGWAPDELRRTISSLDDYPHVEACGLMTMASREGGVKVAQQNFADLRQLRDELQDDCPERVVLSELSMGMSGDLEAAIAEGATLVRIGRALFEGVER